MRTSDSPALTGVLPKREAWLDLGRLFWIFGIAYYHFCREYGGILGVSSKAGGQGVYFFLFASGYGLARSSSASESFGRFIRRRLAKVMLPYWAIAALFIAVSTTLGYGRPTAEGVAIIMLGLVGFAPVDAPSAWWFITALLQCYLVFPLLIRFPNRAAWLSVVALFVVRGLGAALLVPPNALDPTYRILPAVLPAFALGIAAVHERTDLRGLFTGWGAALVIVLEVSGALATMRFPILANLNDLLFIPFAIAVPIWLSRLMDLIWTRRSPDLSWAPNFCFAVFLTHEWPLRRLFQLKINPFVDFSLFVGCALGLGWLGAWLIKTVLMLEKRAGAKLS